MQSYLYVPQGRVRGLSSGTYYYHPMLHRLVALDPAAQLGKEIHAEYNRKFCDEAAFLLVLVAQPTALEPVYGEWGTELMKELCLLEAGYMGQLLMTEAPRLGLGLCPLGWLDFDAVRGHLDLGPEQYFLHAFLGGLLPDGERAEQLPEKLRRFLAEQLPAHMVPAEWIELDEMPLGATGKVDRTALARTFESRGSFAPRRPDTPQVPAPADATSVEETVLAVFRDVLGREISSTDGFFEVGGNSVLMVQAARRLHLESGLELRVTDLFHHPSARALAAFLSKAPEETGKAAARETKAQDRRQRLKRRWKSGR